MILGKKNLKEYSGLGLKALKAMREEEGFPLLTTKQGRPFTVHELVVDWARGLWKASSSYPGNGGKVEKRLKVDIPFC